MNNGVNMLALALSTAGRQAETKRGENVHYPTV
jgi:hypothetical protein